MLDIEATEVIVFFVMHLFTGRAQNRHRHAEGVIATNSNTRRSARKN
jgi:hypothetical protein